MNMEIEKQNKNTTKQLEPVKDKITKGLVGENFLIQKKKLMIIV